jgi:hypothetical protein
VSWEAVGERVRWASEFPAYPACSLALQRRNTLRVRVAAGEQPVTLGELQEARAVLTAAAAKLAAEISATVH